jgi:uncharacterized membrane protein (DUF2068 family)
MMEPSHKQEVEVKAHLKVVGLIDVVTGAFFTVLAVFVSASIFLFAPIYDAPFWQQEEGVVALAIWLFASGVLVALGALSLFAGMGLLKQKRWARALAIIVAVLALAGFPIGTAVGIYTLWVLFREESGHLLGATV